MKYIGAFMMQFFNVTINSYDGAYFTKYRPGSDLTTPYNVNLFDEKFIAPNAVVGTIAVDDLKSNENADSIYSIDADNYKSLLFSAKEDIKIKGINVAFESDATEDVVLHLNGILHRSVPNVGTAGTHFEALSVSMGDITIKTVQTSADNMSKYSLDLTKNAKDKGYVANGFSELGMKSIDLKKFVPSTTSTPFTDKFVAKSSSNLIGSDFGYENNNSDYLEIQFSITSTHSATPNFNFEILNIELEIL